MTYHDYMEEAREACSLEESDRIIKAAADDETISARQYTNIRLTAIRSAYEVNAICWNCAKLGNGCKGTKNSVWTGCTMKVEKEDNEK